jgi:hypothetical protein
VLGFRALVDAGATVAEVHAQIADTIAVEQATERLRQERETFDQKKAQDQRWFLLRFVMGSASVVVLLAIIAFCGFIILNYKDFPGPVLTIAVSALLVDVLGAMLAIWKVVIGSRTPDALAPVTTAIARSSDASG